MILLYIVEIRIINIPLLGNGKTVSYLIVCGLIINLGWDQLNILVERKEK